MAVHVGQVVFAAGVAAVVAPLEPQIGAPMDEQLGPDPVDVDLAGVVEHIGGEAARRPHVHLERGVLVRAGVEEFDVEEPLPHPEGLEAAHSGRLQGRRDVAQRVVGDVPRLVDRLHDALAEHVRGAKHRRAVGGAEAVKGVDGAPDKTLDDVIHRRLAREEADQVLVRVEPEGVERAHALVGLGHHRVAGLADERPGLGKGVHHPTGSHRHSGLAELLLHLRLAADGADVGGAYAEHVEIVPQPRLDPQPVLVETVDAVDLAVLVGEVATGAQQLVIVVHPLHPVVFAQGLAHLGRQGVVGSVPDAQGVGPGQLELTAEAVVLGREVGRKENTVHLGCPGVNFNGRRACGARPFFRLFDDSMIPWHLPTGKAGIRALAGDAGETGGSGGPERCSAWNRRRAPDKKKRPPASNHETDSRGGTGAVVTCRRW